MASKNSTFKIFATGLVLGIGVGALAGAYLSGRGLSSIDTGPSKASAETHKPVVPRDRPPVDEPKDKPTLIDQGAKPANTDKPSPDNATPDNGVPKNPGDKPAGGPEIAPPNTTTPANGDPGHGVDPKSIDPK